EVGEEAVLAHRGDATHTDAEHDRQHGRCGDQLQRGDGRTGQDVGDLSVRGPGGAHGATDEVPEPDEVALQDRIVQVQLVDPLLDHQLLVRSSAGAQDLERVDGQVDHQVHKHRGDEQDDQADQHSTHRKTT